MKFFLAASLAAVAIVLASRSNRTGERSKGESSGRESDANETGSSGASRSLYSEPAAITSSETGAADEFNRPEYASDEQPQLEYDALRRASNGNA